MPACVKKLFFFLPVNILTVWSPAFLAARHTTVCLDDGNEFSRMRCILPEASHASINFDDDICIMS